MTDVSPQAPDSWRAVVAALANDVARAVYAEIVVTGGTSDTLTSLPPSRRRHVIATLTGAGLITAHDGGFVVETRVFAAALAAAPRAPRPEGVERFLGRDGRIAAYPADKAARAELLSVIASRVFARDEVLSERDVNARLSPFADDVAVLRRYLVDHGELERDPSGSQYARPRT